VSAPKHSLERTTPPKPREDEIIAMLQKIVEQLDEIDRSLANLGGTLEAICTRMP
jgi:hypothetical protein